MKMKTQAILMTALLLAGCGGYPSKAPLRGIMQRQDPSSLKLEAAYNDYVRRAFLKDGTEVGIIRMKDGSTAKYWFRSHHQADDIGGTWFQMSDGVHVYMAGWFCCEVQLPRQQFASLGELTAFIHEHHGADP